LDDSEWAEAAVALSKIDIESGGKFTPKEKAEHYVKVNRLLIVTVSLSPSSHFSSLISHLTSLLLSPVQIAQLWLKEKDELKAETFLSKATAYVILKGFNVNRTTSKPRHSFPNPPSLTHLSPPPPPRVPLSSILSLSFLSSISSQVLPCGSGGRRGRRGRGRGGEGGERSRS